MCALVGVFGEEDSVVGAGRQETCGVFIFFFGGRVVARGVRLGPPYAYSWDGGPGNRWEVNASVGVAVGVWGRPVVNGYRVERDVR